MPPAPEILKEIMEENKMRKVMSILSAAFFMTTLCTAAFADIVPGAVLYLDARDNPTHPDAWTNLAGGWRIDTAHGARACA